MPGWARIRMMGGAVASKWVEMRGHDVHWHAIIEQTHLPDDVQIGTSIIIDVNIRELLHAMADKLGYDGVNQVEGQEAHKAIDEAVDKLEAVDKVVKVEKTVKPAQAPSPSTTGKRP